MSDGVAGTGASLHAPAGTDTAFIWIEEYHAQTLPAQIATPKNTPRLRGTRPWVLEGLRSPRLSAA